MPVSRVWTGRDEVLVSMVLGINCGFWEIGVVKGSMCEDVTVAEPIVSGDVLVSSLPTSTLMTFCTTLMGVSRVSNPKSGVLAASNWVDNGP